MKANELTTGDFVYFNCFDGSKIIVRVTGFNDGIVYGDSETGSHWCNIGNVEPITLTPEILEKNGFLNDGVSFWYLDFRIVLSTSKGVSLVCGRQKRFEFVHELQHAMRLCEIEKEIIM